MKFREGNALTAFIGELIGTMVLIILGAGVCANVSLKKSFANGAGWIVIALGWGFAVAFGVYISSFFGSGAHLNPAVTLGAAISGGIAWSIVPQYVAGQLLGAILGSTFVFLFFYPHWKETEDPGTKLGVFATGPAIKHTPSNFLSEMFGTMFLVFGLNAIGLNSFTEGLNPLIVGFFIVAIGLSLGGTTGYAINPARDLGPRIAHAILPIPGKGSSNWSYAWIPVVAPLVGGAVGTLLFQLLFK